MAGVHDALIKLEDKLGYRADNRGICFGVTVKYLEACFVGEQDKFIARISRIATDVNLYERICDVKQKVMDKKTLVKDDLDFLEILSFYDSLELYQSPLSYREVFDAVLDQKDIDKTTYLAGSEGIQDEGGLLTFYSEHHIFRVNGFRSYLKGIQSIITDNVNNPNGDMHIGISLTNHNHAVGLFYEMDTKQWNFMDINQWPPRKFLLKNKSNLLPEAIMRAFDEPPYTGFTTRIITTKNMQFLGVKKALEERKKQYPMTQEMVERMTEHDRITLIFLAAEGGYANVIAELAMHGVDLNQEGYEDFTPVLVAAQEGHATVIAELAKYGVDLNQARTDGSTPVFMAAQHGRVNVINELAKHDGVDLNQARTDGLTPVFIAAQMGHATVIAELAKHGVDLNQARTDGSTPVFIAVRCGHVNVIAELAKHGVDLNQADDEGFTLALMAAQCGHVNVIAELAKHEVDLNQADDEGVTPALMAANNGHVNVIAELARHGVDLNQADDEGGTPALMAAQEGHVNVIAELAKHGVDLNRADDEGFTPALMAANNGHVNVIAELARHEVDLNQTDDEGFTLALMAAQEGHTNVIELLMKHGINLEQSNANGSTPSSMAQSEGYADLANKIEAYIKTFKASDHFKKVIDEIKSKKRSDRDHEPDKHTPG